MVPESTVDQHQRRSLDALLELATDVRAERGASTD
jgi:hypothetical protein